ncbi:MAG: flagellar biosynthesis protein FlhB [Nitrospirae bacterium]|nr:MAG: flagellar biosynthesis protein FlhB [Nitrospirota bacterium]
MAENKDGIEKSEQPSARRLEQARRKGQVASSRELAPLLVLLGGMGMITYYGPVAWQRIQQHSHDWFSQAGTFSLTPEQVHAMAIAITEQVFVPLIPFGLLMVGIGIAAVLIQTGPLWVEEALRPSWSKINPTNGLKRVLSLRGVVELVKSLGKVAIVAVLVTLIIRIDLSTIVQLPGRRLGEAIAAIWESAGKIVLWAGLCLLVLAAADWLYQRWQFLRDMRMTKQEVKEEARDVEGDPVVRSRRLSLQRERARQRMIQGVKQADVVITNPTHVAVALRYDAATMEAPTVLAKGAGVVAEKIKDMARYAGVPIVENRSLAQGLYRTVKVGQAIPVDLYRAAAEVLAYVYRLKQEQERAG